MSAREIRLVCDNSRHHSQKKPIATVAVFVPVAGTWPDGRAEHWQIDPKRSSVADMRRVIMYPANTLGGWDERFPEGDNRYRLSCKRCSSGPVPPVRQEVLDLILNRLEGNGMHAITLDQLAGILSNSRPERGTP